MRTLHLNEKKIDHLQELVDWYYECGEDSKTEIASCIIGALDYALKTDVVDWDYSSSYKGFEDASCGCDCTRASEDTCSEE